MRKSIESIIKVIYINSCSPKCNKWVPNLSRRFQSSCKPPLPVKQGRYVLKRTQKGSVKLKDPFSGDVKESFCTK